MTRTPEFLIHYHIVFYLKNGAPDRIRTCDLCLRRATLYPAELRVRRKCVGSPDGLWFQHRLGSQAWPLLGGGVSCLPGFHLANFTVLSGDDVFGEFSDFGVLAMLKHDARHSNSTFVVRDHARDEILVGVAAIGDRHFFMHGGVGGLKGFG